MTNSPLHSEIQSWNQQGLIPGPTETEESFRQRTDFCLHIKQHLTEHVAELPFNSTDQASAALLEEAGTQTMPLYGIAPSWVPLFFNNYQLSPWHGGCAWIFQLNAHTPTAAFLQLRANFRHKKDYLALYQRDELIAHEMAHIGRMMYQEPKFEEVLAYRSSRSKWRRWLGPIVQSSKESLLFILLFGLIILANIATMTLDQSIAYRWVIWLEWGLIGLTGLALLRLIWRHSQFNRCLKKLKSIYKDDEMAQHVMYRLTDQEMILFSSASEETIRRFIKDQTSFRWMFLKEIYSYD